MSSAPGRWRDGRSPLRCLETWMCRSQHEWRGKHVASTPTYPQAKGKWDQMVIDRVSDDITMPNVWFVLQIVVKFAHLNQW